MKSDIWSAIKVLHEKYEYATKQKWIYDPVSWALYQTWKQFDGKGQSNKNEMS